MTFVLTSSVNSSLVTGFFQPFNFANEVGEQNVEFFRTTVHSALVLVKFPATGLLLVDYGIFAEHFQ